MLVINETFSERLDKALAYRNMKPVDLAKLTGISESTISQYRSGYAKPKEKRLVVIANALRVDPSWLMGIDVPMSKAPTYEAAAGNGRISDGTPSGISPLQLGDGEWLVTVKGDSMMPTLQDGDQVVVAMSSVVDSQDDIMLVQVNGEEHTLKHVKVQKNGLWLLANNDNVYQPRFYTDEEVNTLPVRVLGKVVKLIRDMR